MLDRILDSMPLEQRAVFVLYELEGLTMAVAGAAIGVAVGTVLAREVVRDLQRLHPEIPLIVPADQLFLIAVLACGAALLAAAVPAWQAGRLAPVEALRYE